MQHNVSALSGNHTPEPDWTALIHQIADGDPRALETLYDASSSMVYGLAIHILSNEATAEEITLDVYTQVWRQAKSYDGQRGSPSAWLTVLTRSRAIDRIRSGAQEQQRRVTFEVQEPPSSDATPEEASVLTQRRQWVQHAFAALPPEQREVVELAYFGGLSHSLIAQRLDLPAGTVKTRMRLGMSKLRELLQPLME